VCVIVGLVCVYVLVCALCVCFVVCGVCVFVIQKLQMETFQSQFDPLWYRKKIYLKKIKCMWLNKRNLVKYCIQYAVCCWRRN